MIYGITNKEEQTKNQKYKNKMKDSNDLLIKTISYTRDRATKNKNFKTNWKHHFFHLITIGYAS